MFRLFSIPTAHTQHQSHTTVTPAMAASNYQRRIRISHVLLGRSTTNCPASAKAMPTLFEESCCRYLPRAWEIPSESPGDVQGTPAQVCKYFPSQLLRPRRGGLTSKGAEQLQQYFSKKVRSAEKFSLQYLRKSFKETSN